MQLLEWKNNLKKSKKKDGLGFFCTIYINSLEGENGKKPSQHYTLIKANRADDKSRLNRDGVTERFDNRFNWKSSKKLNNGRTKCSESEWNKKMS